MSVSWETDDSGFVITALREWNFRQLACTKPAENFGQLSVDGQSWVLRRAAELKIDKN